MADKATATRAPASQSGCFLDRAKAAATALLALFAAAAAPAQTPPLLAGFYGGWFDRITGWAAERLD